MLIRSTSKQPSAVAGARLFRVMLNKAGNGVFWYSGVCIIAAGIMQAIYGYLLILYWLCQ
ncbi:hypothetical protein CA264_06895 [Pontibacter actiniarum]|uniref:Uncharacterized protein n=1 Tax=Pontibacter actiniarum TaxID=323450 RepID=A0A1X9YQQ0_9BACT|nr:hypothetical protein CA264_06895 [Pontibacter actiniarum]